MKAEDIIRKKKAAKELTPEELREFLGDWMRGVIDDDEMKKFIRAVKGRGLTFGEILGLMHLMMISDEVMDLTPVPGRTVDMHSVSGAAERVSLQVASIATACGLYTAQLSGPGTGYAVSPLDRLLGVSGARQELDRETFLCQVKRQGYALIRTPERIAPAAERLFALCREVGADGPVPFFVAAEMSRVLAAGASTILLDVPFGEDCLVGTLHEAVLLARTMCALGEAEGRRMGAVVTHIETAPGRTIGSVEEFAESVECLDGEGDPALRELSIDLAGRLMYLSGKGSSIEDCFRRARRVVENGAAAEVLLSMAEAQGGSVEQLENLAMLPSPLYTHEVRARRDGWITGIDHIRLTMAALGLNAVRLTAEEDITPSSGIVLRKGYGECVRKGEVIAVLGSDIRGRFAEPAELVRRAVHIGRQKPAPAQYVYAWIDGSNVELLPPPEPERPQSGETKDNVIRNLFPKGDN